MSWAIACISLGLLAALNVLATVLVVRSDFETQFQKAAQLVLIWVLPFVGAIFVVGVAWNQRPHRKAAPSRDALGYSLHPGSDGDLNRGNNDGDPWGGGHDGQGHGGDGGGH